MDPTDASRPIIKQILTVYILSAAFAENSPLGYRGFSALKINYDILKQASDGHGIRW
jgi:hypothetical protein